MKWPPNKSWTSTTPRNGFRHFVALNYGGKGRDRWIEMVAVLDAKTTLRVSLKELKLTNKWKSGWLQLPKDESVMPTMPTNTEKPYKSNDINHLYTSIDWDERDW
ncbi:TIGR02450 family Trp-rich protein [Prochlorococcus sp. MIT 1300]|uniref:TIGR02450 family Trp-rich protein n=1 Tax=Prochlorococcus sp. MIT 1300 TaxID=3096218 RepID=UPI002A74AC3E|nr:TIGR02450 family Trp-rich protein [Prochlorococcus sp. MIT 1300]